MLKMETKYLNFDMTTLIIRTPILFSLDTPELDVWVSSLDFSCYVEGKILIVFFFHYFF